MLIKLELADGQFTIFDDITHFCASAPNTFVRAPALEEDITSYMEDLFNRPPQLKRDGRKTNVISMIYKSGGDQPTSGVCRNLFVGRKYADERYCFKKITFAHRGEFYQVATELPAYLCSDEGKTLEIIK